MFNVCKLIISFEPRTYWVDDLDFQATGVFGEREQKEKG